MLLIKSKEISCRICSQENKIWHTSPTRVRNPRRAITKPVMAIRKDIFEPNKFYHIYNRAVGKEIMFRNYNNYLFFLEKFEKYILPIADTLSYCLLPNHFHFLIMIKANNSFISSKEKYSFSNYISRSFSNLFNSYAQAFNKQENRYGSLFKNRFKHINVDDDEYLRYLILYIHLNPVHHLICKDYTKWRFSSYQALITNKPTKLQRDYVLELYENRDNFIFCHDQKLIEIDSKLLFE